MEVAKPECTSTVEDKPSEKDKKEGVPDAGEPMVTQINAEEMKSSEPVSGTENAAVQETKTEPKKPQVDATKKKVETNEKPIEKKNVSEAPIPDKAETTKTDDKEKKELDNDKKTPKETLKTPKEIPKTPKEIPKTPKEILKTPKEIPKTLKEIPKTLKEIPKTLKETSKNPKEKDPSPLASFFKDWDKFTSSQQLNIETRIRDMAERLISSEKRRTEWWRIERRNRERRRERRIARRTYLGRRPSRLDMSRGGWRNPWETYSSPPTNTLSQLMRQMDAFVNVVSRITPFSQVGVPHQQLAERPPLLQSPPSAYYAAARPSMQYNSKTDDLRKYSGDSYSSLSNKSQYTEKIEDNARRLNSKSSPVPNRLSGGRPSPYQQSVSYYRWPERQKGISEKAPIRQETSRYTTGTSYSTYKR